MQDRRRIFVRFLLKNPDLSAKDAAIAAGYPPAKAAAAGYALMKHRDVQERIRVETEKRRIALQERLANEAAELEEQKSRLKIDTDSVILGLIDTINIATAKKPVTYITAKGEEKERYVLNLPAAIKGYELLGKHLGMFVERVDVTHQHIKHGVLLVQDIQSEDEWEAGK